MSERLRKVRDELAAGKLDALIVTDNLNVRYLSGFTGTYGVLLTTLESAYLVTDARYAEQASQECPDVCLELVENAWMPATEALIDRLNLRRIGFEGHALSYENWHELQEAMSSRELVSVEDPVGRIRMAKEPSELSAIREAVRIADAVYERISGFLSPGLQEREVAAEIDYALRKMGAEGEAFDTLVASGARSALPHGKPTVRRIAQGELILLDFGARFQGYHSDITRTVVMGAPDSRQEEIYGIVLEAQSKAIEAIRPGLEGREVDAVARECIAKKGYGQYFGYGLGHGLGLSVHDRRILGRRSEIVLATGMVVTVEPGIHIPGWGGIRIEDDVLITESGAEVLTQSPKKLGLA
jgi:Xaa-Pro aminopeptidase